MARILSIDYGQKRTGIAVTDPLQIIANGLVTVNTFRLLDFLKDYFQKEQVERIIVGNPLQTNGKKSENHYRVMAFVRQCKKLFPQIPITFYDERFTSVLAQQTIISAGLKKKDRQNKALVDEVSATILLQSYLNAKQKT